MRGIVFNAPRDVSVEDVPDPAILEPGDALVRVTKAGICGSDMHIYNHGDAFGFDPGCRLGHEFVGVVEEVGADVQRVRPGQKVASPFWISCGECHFCRRGLQTSCVHGGAYGFQPFWPGGGDVQGGQSQWVRVPMADGTLEPVPDALADDEHDARVLPMTDVFTTAYHAVVGADIAEGDTVLVVGDGAVGLLACHAARLFNPAAIVLAGHHDDRLEVGRRLGATHAVNTSAGDDLSDVLGDLTDGFGPQAVIDAVSSPESMRSSVERVQGGRDGELGGDGGVPRCPGAPLGRLFPAQPHDPRRRRPREAIPPGAVAAAGGRPDRPVPRPDAGPGDGRCRGRLCPDGRPPRGHREGLHVAERLSGSDSPAVKPGRSRNPGPAVAGRRSFAAPHRVKLRISQNSPRCRPSGSRPSAVAAATIDAGGCTYTRKAWRRIRSTRFTPPTARRVSHPARG